MPELPPAGWYPDPDTGGTTWRWWDGGQWSAPTPRYTQAPAPNFGLGYGYGYQYASAVDGERYRAATGKFGNWLRWAMVANVVSFLAIAIGLALAFRDDGFRSMSSGGYGHSGPSGRFVAIQLLSIPLNFVAIAYVGSLIAWIYQAGKFAEARGWPAVRGRTLGAFSVLIPIVSLWWPYEAVRDCYPPGAAPPIVLRWWVSYLVTPLLTLPVFLVAIFGSPALITIAIVIAACAFAVPVWFGWQLVRDVEAMQRATPG